MADPLLSDQPVLDSRMELGPRLLVEPAHDNGLILAPDVRIRFDPEHRARFEIAAQVRTARVILAARVEHRVGRVEGQRAVEVA